MSWLDLFRKKKQEPPIEEKPKQKLSIPDFEEKLKKEKTELEKKTEQLKKELKSKVSSLITSIKDNLPKLKEINLESRKEHEKIKLIVKENLFFYTSHLERLVSALEKIDFEKDAKSLIFEIQSTVNNFAKQSQKNYDKATILIGKELEEIKAGFSRFSSEFNSVLNENKAIFDSLDKIESIFPSLENIKEIMLIKEKVSSNLLDLDKDRIKKQASLASLQEEYRGFKSSPEFNEMLKEKEKIMFEINQLRKESLIMKEEVSIKDLIKHYHHDIKKKNLLLSYNEKFMTALEDDEDFELAKMSLEARGHEIKDKLIILKEKNNKIKSRLEEKPSEKKIIIFEEKMKNFSSELKTLEEQIQEERKKKERMSDKEAELLSLINSDSASLFENLEIVQA